MFVTYRTVAIPFDFALGWYCTRESFLFAEPVIIYCKIVFVAPIIPTIVRTHITRTTDIKWLLDSERADWNLKFTFLISVVISHRDTTAAIC